MTLGGVLKKIRKGKGKTQGLTAKRVGISQTYLSLIENDKKNASPKLLERFAEFFDIPAPVLLFLSLDESKVSEEKKIAFQVIKPTIDALIKEYFLEDGKITVIR